MNFPIQPPMSPQPPQGPTQVFFYLQFSQEIQSLQSAHHPDHPSFEQIQSSSGNLQKFMSTNEKKIKQLSEKNGWSFDETNATFNQCMDDLMAAQNNPAALERAQSASQGAEKIFNHINPNR